MLKYYILFIYYQDAIYTFITTNIYILIFRIINLNVHIANGF